MAQKLFDKASLVMIPSQYKEGKIYNIKPEDQSSAFDFERGTAATRVNSSGLIETLYDEATNLLLQSNNFDTTWTTFNATPTSGQTGYDGSSDAWLLNATGASGSLRQDISQSGVQTFSVYVKQGTADAIEIDCSITGVSVKVDLSDGSEITSGASTIATNIESIGSSWYRISVTGSGSATVWRMYVKKADNSAIGSGDNIYIQDAQLETGYFATPYIETTTEAVTRPNRHDTPRLDYSGTEPALLLEPQRTNELRYSSNLSIDKQEFGASLVQDQTGLDGSSNGYTLTEDSNTSEHYVILDAMATATNQQLTSSIFIKPNGRNKIQLWNYYLSNQFARVDIDLSTNTTSNGTASNMTFDNATVEDYPNGWKRVSITSTKPSSTYAYKIRVSLLDDNGNASYQGNGTGGVILFGQQIELASYPTSYIPTNGQTETRNFETYENTHLSDFIGTGDCTFLIDFNYNVTTRENTSAGIKFYSGSNLFGIKGLSVIDRTLQIRGYVGFTGNMTLSGSQNNTIHKVAVKVTGATLEVFYNGTKLSSTLTGFSTYTWSEIELNGQNSFVTGTNKIVLFPEPLTDSECISLTTL